MDALAQFGVPSVFPRIWLCTRRFGQQDSRTWQGLRYLGCGRSKLPQPDGRATGTRTRLPTDRSGDGRGDTYWRGTEFQSFFGQHLPHDASDRLYVVWADLTDIWELHVERRTESVALMREAAREFLALDGTSNDLDAYLTRVCERLGQS